MAKMEGPKKKAADAVPELAAKVDRERAELAETVSALAAKADVKARVTGQVAVVKEQVADQVATAKGKVADQVATVKETAAELTHEVGYQVDQVASEASATLVSFRDRVRAQPGPYVLAATGLVVAFVMVRKLTRLGK